MADATVARHLPDMGEELSVAVGERGLIGVSPDHTSVPRWPQEPPEVDPTGRSYVVVASGEEGTAVASEWAATIVAAGKALWVHYARCASPSSLALLQAQLVAARVGTRVMVAAPELDVLDVLRVARGAGAIDAELRAHVTSTGLRRVQCPHCLAHTVANVQVGDTVPCTSCRRTLIVYHHVSRLHGAYLGYMVDAEEPAE